MERSIIGNNPAAETNLKLQLAVRQLQESQKQLTASLLQRQEAMTRLRQEREALQANGSRFDAQYVQQATRSSQLQLHNYEIAQATIQAQSPRSSSALQKLDALERAVVALENECFALVPLIARPETRTALAILSGKTDEVQSKHVDAIQSLGLACQATIMARRRALVKRLDILSTLAKTLHKIAGDGKA